MQLHSTLKIILDEAEVLFRMVPSVVKRRHTTSGTRTESTALLRRETSD